MYVYAYNYIAYTGVGDIDDSCVRYTTVNVEDVQSCTAPATSLHCQAFLLNYTGTCVYVQNIMILIFPVGLEYILNLL